MNTPRLKTHTACIQFCGQAFDMEFIGSCLDSVELVKVSTSSGNSIGNLLECMLTTEGIPAWYAAEVTLRTHLAETNYFDEAEVDARDRSRENVGY